MIILSTAHRVFGLELDALGDELLLDDDSSYLDEASSAPSIPEGMPSDSKTNKVTLISIKSGFVPCFSLLSCTYSGHVINSFVCVSGRRSGRRVWIAADSSHVDLHEHCRLVSGFLYSRQSKVVRRGMLTLWVNEAFGNQACGLVMHYLHEYIV